MHRIIITLASACLFAPTLSAQSPEPKNLIDNSSFELGLGHGWGFHYYPTVPMNVLSPDRSTAWHGKSSFRLLDQGRAIMNRITHKAFPAKPGVYTLSFYAKADRPGVFLQVQGSGIVGGDREINLPDVELTKEWKRYHVTGEIKETPYGVLGIYLGVSKYPEGASAWFDAVQFERGPLTDYSPRYTIEEYFHCEPQGRMFEPGTVEFTLDTINHFDAPVRKTFSCEVRNYWDQVVWEKTFEADLTGRERKQERFRIPLADYGCYRLLAASDGQNVDEVVFSVVPPPRTDVSVDESFFGAHVPLDSDYLLATAKRMGFRWLRTHDQSVVTMWYTVQPEPDKWVFDPSELARAKKYGFKILGMLYRAPEWAFHVPSSQPFDANPRWSVLPSDLSQWDTYVRKTVGAFKEYVSAWELFNEIIVWDPGPPPTAGPGEIVVGTAENYAEIMRRSAKIIHEVDPNAIVVGLGGSCPTSVSARTIRDILKSGAAGDVDVLSYHIYWHDSNEPSMYFFPQCAEFAPGKPLWNTEMGRHQPTFYRTYPSSFRGYLTYRFADYPVEQYPLRTAETAQMFIDHMSQSAPLKRFFYYHLKLTTSPLEVMGCFLLLEYDGALRPGGVTAVMAAHFLDGAKFERRFTIDDPKLVGKALFRRGDELVAAFYSRPDPTLSGTMQVPGRLDGVECYDLVGGKITPQVLPDGDTTTLRMGPEPIYLVARGTAAKGLPELLDRSVCTWKIKPPDASARYTVVAVPTVLHPQDVSQSDGPVPYWAVLGPLPEGNLDLAQPKIELEPDKSYDGKFEKIAWRGMARDEKGYVDLDALFQSDYATAYAWVEIVSPAEQTAEVAFGSDDSAAVWVNDKQVHSIVTQRTAYPGEAHFPLTLKQGKNTVLVQVLDRAGGWGFYFDVQGLTQPVLYRFPAKIAGNGE